MICRIKKSKKVNDSDIYYVDFLFFNYVLSKKDLKPTKLPVCNWTNDVSKAKIFKTKKEAEKEVNKYRLKNVEYERVN